VISTASRIGRLELAGNALCLDFANTVNCRPVPQRDYLAEYADLLAWAEYAGGLPTGATKPLRVASGPGAAAVLSDAHLLRDTVYAVFSPIAAGRGPAAADVDRLGSAYAGAMRHLRIAGASGGGRYALAWPVEVGRLDAPLWPVAQSAGELLLSGPLDRIGECPSCGWLFLDTSRNGTRRWCSMATCGSRDKMARYHRRRRPE
jgi:predicted RNA-binding Zn ribbon-like protein